MNEKQKQWLIKTEKNIRTRFPDDVLNDEDGKGWDELTDYIEEIYQKANRNETVKRWLMEILVEYNNRHKILTQPERKTDNERLREYYEKERREAKRNEGKEG